MAGLVPDWPVVSWGEVGAGPDSVLGVKALGVSVRGEFFTGVRGDPPIRGDCLPVLLLDTGVVFILIGDVVGV